MRPDNGPPRKIHISLSVMQYFVLLISICSSLSLYLMRLPFTLFRCFADSSGKFLLKIREKKNHMGCLLVVKYGGSDWSENCSVEPFCGGTMLRSGCYFEG